MSPILNGSSILLSETSGTLPNVNEVLRDYFQPMIFNKIVKSIVNFQTVETSFAIAFQGVWQPSGGQNLSITPTGQQAWAYYTVHADPTLDLSPDDVIVYQNKQYRVMGKMDYSLYGYLEYQLISDWSGAGPL